MDAPAPETQPQAAQWQTVCWSAEVVGLCPSCAAQLAWGVMSDFSRVRPPCAGCQTRMSGWTLEQANGWRLPDGPLLDPAAWNAVASG